MNEKNSYYVGVVYCYTLTADCPENGWCYIGETQNEQKRKYDWQESKNTSYGGKKISDARKMYGVNTTSTWSYYVLEYVYSDTKAGLVFALEEAEKYHIALAKLDGKKLFNTNSGGKGRG